MLHGRHNRGPEDTERAYCDTPLGGPIHNFRFSSTRPAPNFGELTRRSRGESASSGIGPHVLDALQGRCAGSGAREWSVAHILSPASLRAQRSNPESLRGGRLDCFAALAMTEQGAADSLFQLAFESQTHLRILAAHSPELCFVASPSCPRGHREGRVPAGTRGPPREKHTQENRTAAYRWCQSLGLPCAVVGRLMPCSPGSRVRSGLPRLREIHRHRAG